MEGKRGRDITVPSPQRKVTVVLADDMADKLSDVTRGLRKNGAPTWSVSAIIHQLLDDMDVAKVVKRLSTIEALSGGRK